MLTTQMIFIRQVSLWRLPAPDPSGEPLHELAMGRERGYPLASLGEPQTESSGFKTAATAMLWSPAGAGSSQGEAFVTLADGQLKRWSLGDGRWGSERPVTHWVYTLVCPVVDGCLKIRRFVCICVGAGRATRGWGVTFGIECSRLRAFDVSSLVHMLMTMTTTM